MIITATQERVVSLPKRSRVSRDEPLFLEQMVPLWNQKNTAICLP